MSFQINRIYGENEEIVSLSPWKVGLYFKIHWEKFWSIFPDGIFLDKVTLILPYHSTFF